MEPRQAFALQHAHHQHADGGQAKQQAAPVELAETFEAQRVLRQAPGHHQQGDDAARDDLPERPLPAQVLGPEGGQRRAQAGAEGGAQRIAAQAIQLDVRRQEAQRHRHQHGRQGAAGRALHHAQEHQHGQVRRKRA
ncbi:hypothetical protein D3C72_1475230 [compost metagenome]